MNIPEYELEHLLGYDGRRHFLLTGHFLKFEVRTVEKSERVPHGIAYSLTLHDPNGQRLMGFDNAHPVAHKGRAFVPAARQADHWHRTTQDAGRPYLFVSAVQLLDDFFDEAERILEELGVAFEIVADREEKDK
ncbi:toxin-antitoxin system TumE family protein [Glaciimonas sp. GG7]